MSIPTRVENAGFCNLDPYALTLRLQSRLKRLAGLKREKLRSQFHYSAVNGVESEGHYLIAGHIKWREWRLAFAFAFARRGGAFGPPLTCRERVEFGVLSAERLWSVLSQRRVKLEGKCANSGCGEFECGAAVDGFHVR
jgi:hypothetical protein